MNTIYWFEPIAVMNRLKEETGWWKLFFFLVILVNYCTLGILKVIMGKAVCVILHKKCYVRFWNAGDVINEMWKEKMIPYAFEQ